jgi:hypothetical protein
MIFVNTVLKNGALQRTGLEAASSAHCAVSLHLHLEFNLLVSIPVIELTTVFQHFYQILSELLLPGICKRLQNLIEGAFPNQVALRRKEIKTRLNEIRALQEKDVFCKSLNTPQDGQQRRPPINRCHESVSYCLII